MANSSPTAVVRNCPPWPPAPVRAVHASMQIVGIRESNQNAQTPNVIHRSAAGDIHLELRLVAIRIGEANRRQLRHKPKV